MARRVNRPYQRQVLEKLAEAYPQPVDVKRHDFGASIQDAQVNLAYLYEHGLITAKRRTSTGHQTTIYQATITAAGIDFLADDGGLSAILGTVTVKFHDDTIRQLLLARVDQSADTDESTKSALRKAIGSVSTEGLKHLTTKALDWGLSNAPGAMHWLAQTIPHLPHG